MESIDFELLHGFSESARSHIARHGDYEFLIRDHHVLVNDYAEMIYCAHSKHFDIVLAESWRIMSGAREGIKGFMDLLRAIWDSPDLAANRMSFKGDLDLSFDEFFLLVKKQFFYFDNQTEQFMFPLFRLLKDDGDVIGGFFHFLIKHFEQYSLLHKTSKGRIQYWPNEVLGVLVSTCTWPDSCDKEAANIPQDHLSIRRRVCRYYDRETGSYEEKAFKAALYYESKSDLYFLTSFYRD